MFHTWKGNLHIIRVGVYVYKFVHGILTIQFGNVCSRCTNNDTTSIQVTTNPSSNNLEWVIDLLW